MATPGNLSLVASFDPSLGQLPESVTADAEGNFYLSMANTVHKLTPDGELSLFAQLPIPPGTAALGVKFGPDGQLYVASGGFSPLQDASYVFRVSSTGTVTPFVHLDPTGFPR
jgi:sugar lactone lactonase YvrE